MKSFFFVMIALLSLGSCTRHDAIEGQWDFVYVWSTNDKENATGNDDEYDIMGEGVSLLLLNIAMSDFSYHFVNGMVRLQKMGEDSDEIVGSYDKKGNVRLINDDESYEWSFNYRIKDDSLYLVNDEYKIVFVKPS